jgi:hypothetical protein
LVVAADVICYCGRTAISWAAIDTVAIVGGSLAWVCGKIHAFVAPGTLSRAWSVSSLRHFFKSEGGLSLYQLLDVARNRDCSDPRDKVYSILGMTEPKVRARVQADYSSSSSEVFTRAIIADIETSGNLRSLLLVDNGCMSPTENLPSWVADLQSVAEIDPLVGYNRTYFHTSFEFSDDSRTLYVEGFILDTIEEIGVEKTIVPFKLLPNGTWIWDIENMIARLVNGGGTQTQRRTNSDTSESLRRSVARSIFDVMIAGHISTYSGWEPYHVRFADEDWAGMDSPWIVRKKYAQGSEQPKPAEETS